MTTLDRHRWLRELTPAQRWAWVGLVEHVRETGRPPGHTRATDPKRWAKRLDVPADDFVAMLTAAEAAGAVRREPKRLVVTHLAEPAPSGGTLRMRRHRGEPAFTARDAGEAARLMLGVRDRRRAARAILAAHARLSEEPDAIPCDPATLLGRLASDYQPPDDPVCHLERALAEVLRRPVDLSTPRPSGVDNLSVPDGSCR